MLRSNDEFSTNSQREQFTSVVSHRIESEGNPNLAGLASGTVWVAGDILDCSAEMHRIEPHQVDGEMERVRRAFVQVEAQLEESARRVSEQIDPSLAEIFRAHGLMLESLHHSNEFEEELRKSLTSAAEAVKRVFRRWEAKFAAIPDETLRQRADDILDLARRVLRQLEGADTFGLAAMPAGSVLVTQRLLPSDVVGLSPRIVQAIVVESLGQGSHAAVLTRERVFRPWRLARATQPDSSWR